MPFQILVWFTVAGLLSSCRDSSVKSYRIAKEKDEPRTEQSAANAHRGSGASPSGDMSGGVVAKASGADLEWSAPAPWKTKAASAMRKGSYTVENGSGGTADVSITAFPGDVGGENANVNRWRGQLQLAPAEEREIASSITRLESNGLHVSYVDLVNGPQRMLAAFVPFDGATWFFKLTGPDALVAGEKEAFVSFLKTVKPGAVAQHSDVDVGGVPSPRENANSGVGAPRLQTDMAATDTSPKMSDTVVIKSSGPDLKWTAPAQWQVGPPNGMRKASYKVTGEAGVTGDVSITAFPGDVGGELANVNRWRNQLGLPSIAASEVASTLVRREHANLQIAIVEIASSGAAGNQRLLGAIVPFNGATWFFKLTGPDQLVAGEKSNFLAFLETIQTP